MIDRMELSNKASSIRKKLGEDNSSPIDIFSLVNVIDNLTLVKYPLKSNISGMCIKSASSCVLAINSSMSIGRQRFSLAHELYHYYFDEQMTSTICSSIIGTSNEVEKAADQFASYMLMPSAALYERILEIQGSKQAPLVLEDVVRLEQYFGISRQAMLYRLQEEGKIDVKTMASMQKDVILSAAKLGYDTALYKASPQNSNKGAYGYYIKQSEQLLRMGRISTGKYEEWLLDAFRDDIVYGDDLQEGELVD